MVDTLSIPKSKVFRGVCTWPIAEIPKVLFMANKRPSTCGVTSSIIIEVLVFLAREIAIFLAIDGIVHERISTLRQARTIEVQSLTCRAFIVTKVVAMFISQFMGKITQI